MKREMKKKRKKDQQVSACDDNFVYVQILKKF